MASRNLIVGDDGGNVVRGGAGADLIYGWNPDGPQGAASAISATRVASGLDRPLFVTGAPGDADTLFVVGKAGLVNTLDPTTGAVNPTPFLDLSGEVVTAGERGLLGLAFHPDYAENGRFYVHFTNAANESEVREYRVSPADGSVVPGSGKTVLTVDQTAFNNHKAGWIGFGPDGKLYVALGDGGGGDPDNNAQNVNSLLGKILRIDVDGDDFADDPGRNYSIPGDNPFVGGDGADEVWAYGLRNPFRDSFDRGLGDLYIADVGQGSWEEIDLGASGANYGWKRYEGPDVYDIDAPLNGPHTPPIHFYGHDVGESVTGGYVYRGQSEGLHGQYFFGDFISGRIWTLEEGGSGWVATERTGQIATDAGTIDNISSFGEDARGNLYVVDYDGEIFRLTPEAASADRADRLLGGDGDDMAFAGSGDDRVFGEAGDDELNGMDGDDFLDGGSGSDTLVGGRGDDAYRVDTASDSVLEVAGEGRDRLLASADYVLAGDASIEVLRAATGAGLSLTGNGGRNALFGNSGADALDGWAGNDVLTGAGGADIFIFRGAWGIDRVADFEDGSDLFDLPSSLTFERLVITEVDADRDGASDDVRIAAGVRVIDVLDTDDGAIDGTDFLF